MYIDAAKLTKLQTFIILEVSLKFHNKRTKTVNQDSQFYLWWKPDKFTDKHYHLFSPVHLYISVTQHIY